MSFQGGTARAFVGQPQSGGDDVEADEAKTCLFLVTMQGLDSNLQIVEMWKDGNVISFRVKLKERGIVSINNGKCTIR